MEQVETDINVRSKTEPKQVTSKLADTVIPTDIERGVWDYKGKGKWAKVEPQIDCETCKHYNPHHEAIARERCLDGKYSRYEPKTEPQKKER